MPFKERFYNVLKYYPQFDNWQRYTISLNIHYGVLNMLKTQ